MKTREWERIFRQANVDAFLLWLMEQPENRDWKRGDVCCCPLHDFIEWATGDSLSVNSPEISEHWAERDTQSWPTPWWMTWIIRAVDSTGTGPITRDELLSLAEIGVRQDFAWLLNSEEEWLRAA